MCKSDDFTRLLGMARLAREHLFWVGTPGSLSGPSAHGNEYMTLHEFFLSWTSVSAWQHEMMTSGFSQLWLEKLQYFGHLMQRADSLEKTLMLGKIEGRRRAQQKMSWLDNITDSRDMSLSKLPEMVKDREAWHATVHGIAELDPT